MSRGGNTENFAQWPLFLSCELANRELGGRLLVAAEALRRGHTVFIGHKSVMPGIAKGIGTGVLVDKSHGDREVQGRLSGLSSTGVVCTALDEEGLTFSSIEEYRNSRVMHNVLAFELMPLILTWGARQSRMIRALEPSKRAPTLAEVGNPRFDLLREPFRDLLRKESSNLLGGLQNFTLVVTNFTGGNISEAVGLPYMERLKFRGIISSPETEAFYEELANVEQKLFDEYVNLVKSLAISRPLRTVVVRPHPSEDLKTYKDLFRNLKNVRVVRKGSIAPWLLAASVVVHPGSTSAVEASVLGTPAVGFLPEQLRSRLSKETASAGPLLDSREKVLEFLDDLDAEGSQRTFFDLENLSGSIANVRGDFSFLRIMDALEAVVDNLEEGWSSEKDSTFRRIHAIVRSYVFSILGGFVSRNRWMKTDRSRRLRNRMITFPPLHEKVIARSLRNLLGVYPGFAHVDFVCEQIGPYAVRLVPRQM